MTLQTQSSERGSAVTGTQIENINVDGRSPLDLAKLIPGVQFTTGASYAVGNAANGANNFTANGTRPSQNQVTLNGIGNVDTGNNGGMNASVSNDSIAEFKVLTGAYQAEYGRSAGAQIQLVTKSGTSQFHGSGYLYHRNEGMNANTYLNNIRPQFGLTATPKPLFRYNDPGYTIGGPVPLKKWNLKNRLFFFWSQEWQQQLVPNTARNVTVPTALERKGDFSQSVSSANHQAVKIYDPTNGQPFPGQRHSHQPDLGARPGIAEPLSHCPIRRWPPMPTCLRAPPTITRPSCLVQQPRREDLMRMDFNVTEKLRVYGHYIKDQQNMVHSLRNLGIGDQPADHAHFRADSGQEHGGGSHLHDQPDHDQRIQRRASPTTASISSPRQGCARSPWDPIHYRCCIPTQCRMTTCLRWVSAATTWPTHPRSVVPMRRSSTTTPPSISPTVCRRSGGATSSRPASTCSAAARIRRPSEPSTAATTSATRVDRRVRIRSIPATGTPMRCWAFSSPSTRRSIISTACTVTGTSNSISRIRGSSLPA